MQSNVRELAHVLVVNTPRSHQYIFRATDVSSGLAREWCWLECHKGGWDT